MKKTYTENEITALLTKAARTETPSREHFKDILDRLPKENGLPVQPKESIYFIFSNVKVRAFAGVFALFAILSSTFILEKNHTTSTNSVAVSNDVIEEDNAQIQTALQNELDAEKNAHEDLLALNAE